MLLVTGSANSQDVKFPRRLTNEGNVLTVYQPQVEKWHDHKNIEYRNAFALRPATRQGSSPYGQWGYGVGTDGSGNWAQTAHSSNSQGTVADARTSEGGKVIAASGDNGSGGVAKTGSGDVYAAKDGNIYKKTDDGWSSYNNGEWSSANKPTQDPANAKSQAAAAKAGTSSQTSGANAQARQTGSGTFNSQQLNREYQNRQSGNAQMQQFNNRSAYANRSYSGSRPSGGGRRR